MEVPHHRDRQLWRYGLEEKPRGFRVLPRRWVERTFAWLGLSRRLSKDCERSPETAEAMMLLSAGLGTPSTTFTMIHPPFGGSFNLFIITLNSLMEWLLIPAALFLNWHTPQAQDAHRHGGRGVLRDAGLDLRLLRAEHLR
jgi:hypothetical protein